MKRCRLVDLTGQESGLVLYGDQAIVCTWSNIGGLPRLDPTGYGIVGLGEDLPMVRPDRVSGEYLAEILRDVEIIYSDAPSEDLEALLSGQAGPGRVFRLLGAVVIAPDSWN